jgi:hypothetical protein
MFVLLFLALAALGTLWAEAAPVGQFLQAEGEVDLSKGGKQPAAPVKAQDPVEVGDVVRTKSNGRAQIRFVDDSVLTIAPESRVAVEEFMFDAAKGDRKAVVEVFRGLVHTTVNKVDPKKEPDFLMKTHTAILGVRGTKWYTKLLPNATEVYTEGSLLEVQTRQVLIETKVVEVGRVLLRNLEFTSVGLNQKPLPPVKITLETLKGLEQQLKTGLGGKSGGEQGVAPLFQGLPRVVTLLGQDFLIRHLASGFYVPPQPERLYAFQITWSGSWEEFFSEGYNGQVMVYNYGSGTGSPFFQDTFASDFQGLFTAPSDYSTFYGDFTAKATGTYRKVGDRYVGVMKVTFYPTMIDGGNGNGDYGYRFLAGRFSGPRGSFANTYAAFSNGNTNSLQATLSGPFLFSRSKNLLAATLSGPYQLYTGDKATLRGVLKQTVNP